jgi:hypothetical protein
MMIHPRDTTPTAGAMLGGSAALEAAGSVDSAYRLLKIRGLSSTEAGNLVAYLNGLHPAESGWTVDEIKHLLAIRAFVAGGVIES